MNLRVPCRAAVGNTASNRVWESTLDDAGSTPRPKPGAPREAVERFIRAKYVDRAFVARSVQQPEPEPDPGEQQLVPASDTAPAAAEVGGSGSPRGESLQRAFCAALLHGSILVRRSVRAVDSGRRQA